MATTQQVVIRRTVATTAELKAGPLMLGLGQWGFATEDSILVARDLDGNFHDIMSDGAIKQYIDGNCLVKSPVNTMYDLPDGEPDGTMRMVLETASYYYVAGGAWIKIAKPGDAPTSAILSGTLPIIVAGSSPTVVSHQDTDGTRHVPATLNQGGKILIAVGDGEKSEQWGTPNLDNIDQGTLTKKLTAAEYTDLTDGGDTTLHYHSADRGATYTFGTAATVWTVTHNKGYYPSVTVIVGGKKVMADIVNTSVNALTVTFNSAKTGSVYVH